MKSKILVSPFDSSICRYEGGFEWTFRGKNSIGNDTTVVMKFERWWLSYLSSNLRDVLVEEVKEMDRLLSLSEINPKNICAKVSHEN